MVLSPIDYVIIALYFIVIVAIGFIAARFAKTKEDYLVAGRRLSFPLFFGCMAALTLGGGSTIGSAQLGYEFGLGGIWLNLSIGLGLVAAGFLVTSKLSKLRALSVNEVVESSYGPIARVFSSALTLIYTLTLSVVQVISIGTIINGVTGIDATLSMLVGGGIVILYTFVGGMWSVTMTDIVQFVVKTVGILILAPIFCISAAGGWDALVSKVPETYLSGCVFVPLVASFVLKRFSPKAGLYALGASTVAVTGCFVVVGTASSVPIVAGMASGLVAYAAANLLSKQKVPSPFE